MHNREWAGQRLVLAAVFCLLLICGVGVRAGSTVGGEDSGGGGSGSPDGGAPDGEPPDDSPAPLTEPVPDTDSSSGGGSSPAPDSGNDSSPSTSAPLPGSRPGVPTNGTPVPSPSPSPAPSPEPVVTEAPVDPPADPPATDAPVPEPVPPVIEPPTAAPVAPTRAPQAVPAPEPPATDAPAPEVATVAPTDAPVTESPVTPEPTDAPAPGAAATDAPTDAPVPVAAPVEATPEPSPTPAAVPVAEPTPAPLPDAAAPAAVEEPPSSEAPAVAPADAAANQLPSPTVVLGTAYELVGTGLLPWKDSQTAFERAYQLLLADQNITLAAPTTEFLGVLENDNTTASRRRSRMLLQAASVDNVTVYYEIGDVPATESNATAADLGADSTLAAFLDLLQQNGLNVANIKLVAVQEGGIQVPEGADVPKDDKLNGGAIAGIVVAVIVGIVAVLLLAYLCVSRTRRNKLEEKITYHTPVTPVGVHTAQPFNGSPAGSPYAAATGGSAHGPGAFRENGHTSAASTPHRSQVGEPAPEQAAGTRPSPVQRISSWWDERVRGQGTSNYGVQLGVPQEDFDPYAPSLKEGKRPSSP